MVDFDGWEAGSDLVKFSGEGCLSGRSAAAMRILSEKQKVLTNGKLGQTVAHTHRRTYQTHGPLLAQANR